MPLNDDEARELLELLAESELSDWERRRRRMRAAETRLGLREGGRFTGKGLAEIIGRARTGEPITSDQFIITHAGFLPGESVSGNRRKS